MPTAWTKFSPAQGEVWHQLEPVGFGNTPFGDPSNIENGLKIHQKGFGDPRTKFTAVTIPATTWTAV